MIEQVHVYVAQVLQKMSQGNIKTVEPKRKQVENFSAFCENYFKRTVFTDTCPSWYKSSPPGTSAKDKLRGSVTVLWPGSSVHAMKALESPRWEDFELGLLDGNDFGWFGNGWTVAEKLGDLEGISWYLNKTKYLHESLGEHA
jgi:hypothetical protein